MPRPSKQQIDDEILETAATLFARHGFRETSIQRVADAVGYSKTGLLHRYPSKEALQTAVLERGLSEMRTLADGLAGLPPGPGRDRAAVEGVARLALAQPGTVALLLSGLLSEPQSEVAVAMRAIGDIVFAAFAVDPQTEPARLLRITGALGALAVASVALREAFTTAPVTELVELACDALGHQHPNH